MTKSEAEGAAYLAICLSIGTGLLVGHYHGVVVGVASVFLSFPAWVFALAAISS